MPPYLGAVTLSKRGSSVNWNLLQISIPAGVVLRKAQMQINVMDDSGEIE
jgi:hypothetical protein